jgi:acetyl/propionyl-CoA carboxylase alpha subunit/acetyl-CoA carboxylase carboxyltransferase component
MSSTPSPFQRIAIVNRGEPAMRLIRAVRELNLERGEEVRTLALYTEADRGALFTREADAALCLGPAMFLDPKDLDASGAPRRKSSYLDYGRLRDALARGRADAAWVGWGFVAEHAAFAELCAELGVAFIGPPPEAMRRLGDKIGSKRLAQEAGVPVAPWSQGPVASLDEARAWAARIGYPLLVKATAGGGGRGIRFVSEERGLAEAFASASSEAQKSFGDGAVFLEKRVLGARHVEVQVLADAHGTAWAAGVRDCSVQRANQKVLEEAPCPALAADEERALEDAAVRLALAAGYRSAGTAEFLFDEATRRFYFMEMNTRLQVEHPITEATTGLDLVRLQLAVARGERLPPKPPASRGWAIEARLCAEDPERGFAPAPGRVAAFRPALGPGVRTDSGVREGDRIPVEFDSMIAKIIAFGETREEARGRLCRALQEMLVVVEGGATNRSFLLGLLSSEDFARARISTGWLDERMRQGGARPPGLGAAVALLSTAIELHVRQLEEEELNFFALAARGRPAMAARERRPIELRLAGAAYEFRVFSLGPGSFRAEVDGASLDLTVERDGPYESRLGFRTAQGIERRRVVSVPAGLDHRVEVDGASFRISRDASGLLRAPAPGLVLALHVTVGAEVRSGERLISLEAMKMEMPVTAPFDGRVRALQVAAGVQVSAGHPLLVLEPLAQAESRATEVERVRFPSNPADERSSPAEAQRRVVAEMSRLMLGYHVAGADLDPLLERWAATFEGGAEPGGTPADFVAVHSILGLFLDVEALFCKRCASPAPSGLPLSNEESFHVYLREFRAEGRGLPEPFLASLRAALAHYGLSSLADSPALREALVWLYRSHQNSPAKARVAIALLQRCVDGAPWRRAVGLPGFHELLDRLVALTLESEPSVAEAAQGARYALFEGRALEERQRAWLARGDAALARLREDPHQPERAAQMEVLVDAPLPLIGHLTSALVRGDGRARALVLETMARRLYRGDLRGEPWALLAKEGPAHVLSRVFDQGQSATLLSTFAALEELPQTLEAMKTIAARLPPKGPLLLDLYLSQAAAPDEREDAAALGRALEALSGGGPAFARVCATLVNEGRAAHHYTFAPSGGRWLEDEASRGFHAKMAERLELWRMRNFEVRRVPTRFESVYLFLARARANPKDERFFAVLEIRDLAPLRDGRGRLTALPELEHALLESFHALREQQARRGARQRLHWNRITVFLRSPLAATREELLEIGRRLHRSEAGLGIEKICVRAFWREGPDQPPRDVVLSFADRTGHRLELAVAEPHGEPLRALDDYALKLVRARQRRITYVYEIVKMLAPAEASPTFPAGDFEEYDLPEGGSELASVRGRPFGGNSANVVVGVVKNYTAKHPEGMARVLVLGDGTREMGALSEPECRRIIAALDLARRMKVPLEWFPVSSGAKIAMDSGTENLDWTAAVLRRIVEFTQDGGEVNVVVDGINVGAQSYWNAEATMLMHTRGCLVMTARGSMLLTGKRALDYSGGVSAEDNLGIGGFERIMGPNGQVQYYAPDLDEACKTLLRYYEHTYVAPGESHPRRRPTSDRANRDIGQAPYLAEDRAFGSVGEIFSDEKNPARRKPFDIRALLRAVADVDAPPLERWTMLRDGESAVVWDVHLGGWPVCLIGVESKPLARLGYVPSDGPESWSGGTLFPLSSKKVARALNAASGNRPAVVLANLSGFDGSPESLRRLQLEYGAEIGRAVVNFKGPLVFCVVARYHGGAYVVFSKRLNPGLKVLALQGSFASVIGGAPAAAVVFPEEARALALKDPRIVALQEKLKGDRHPPPRLRRVYEEMLGRVNAEKAREIAERFDAIHTVQRAREVGSLDEVIAPSALRPALIEAVETGLSECEMGAVETNATRRG